MRPHGSTLLPVLLIAAAATTARAQDMPHAPSAPHRVWAAAGLGGGGGYRGGDGIGVMGQLVYERAPHHFALRAIALVDRPGSSNESLGEFGLLYGRVATGNMGFASAAAGVSAVYLDRCGDSSRDCITVGVPLVAELAITPLDVLGIGLQLFGNVNPKTPYLGLFVIIPIGWMP